MSQKLDMYIKVTADNFQHYVKDDVVHCTSVIARYAALNGDAIYCDSAGDPIVPDWPPMLVSAVVENAAPTLIVITYDMAMDVTNDTGFGVVVDAVAANISGAAASGDQITLTLSAAITAGEDVLLTYDASAGNAENTNVIANAVALDTINRTVTNNVT